MFSSEDKRVRVREKTTTEAEGRVRELLLLLGTAGIEVGRCGGRKLLCLVATGVEVGQRGSYSSSWQLGWRSAGTAGIEPTMLIDA